jgi:hypothetical protein
MALGAPSPEGLLETQKQKLCANAKLVEPNW